jgi:Flp pilus assembly protein TadG
MSAVSIQGAGSRGHARPARNSERGAIAIIAAFIFIALGGFLALSLNVGHRMAVKAQLQASYDAAALAGVHNLNGTTAKMNSAHQTAQTYGTRHSLDRNFIGLDANLGNGAAGDIVAGYWDPTLRQFFSDGQTINIGGTSIVLNRLTTPEYYIALKVQAITDGAGAHNAKQNVFFNAFLSQSTYQVGTSAVAVGGGPCNEKCSIPLVIPSCTLVDAGGNLRCDQPQGFFAPSTIDTIGLTDLNQNPATNPNTGSVADATSNGMTCAHTVKAGSTIGVQNGDNINSKQIYDGFRALMCPPGTPLANCPTYAVPVVDMGSCPPPNFNQPRAVVGFVRVALLCVKRNGKADLPDCDPGFTGAEIKFAMSCGGISGAAAGCASLGYSARTFRLVQ